ncbi:alpha/beta hydrolase [Myxococcus sp. K15C18031901]|uniref:alpha/beta fold hydrolase n=1 Tax=Myxococcus dinghuensis TaxID=2906761 RepID=UPI0020A75F27|nr:alpha/beta hydrolase [Myxococcus dinghuensis]MCP3099019.1 alpha/beta hydrolase [Myxococcus dinghuensis]
MRRVPLLAALVALALVTGCATTSAGANASTPTRPFQVKRSGQGRPVLFIPGLASSGEVWDETLAHLQGHYDCHVFTLAGFAGQPAIPAPFLPTVRRALADYIREQGLEKPIIVGHSLGGVVALGLAADAPELVGGLFIVDSLPFLPASMDPSATAESARPQAEQFRTMLRMQTVEQRALQSRNYLRGAITDSDKVDIAARWGADSDPETLAQAYYELSTTDLRPELSRITAPTFVVGSWSGLKGRVPREAVEAVYRGQYQRLSTARVELHDTARHFIMWDAPQDFFRMLDTFLASPPVEPQR